MLTLPKATCKASIVRARLKHSWLENAVLNKTPEIIVMLRHEAGWAALQHFPDNAEQALVLADEVESGFSPGQLVDTCAPLAGIPDDQRCLIRQAIHAAYLECFDVPRTAQGLREAAAQMQAALSALLAEWNKADEAVSDSELRTCWGAVLDKAERLRIALDALPKGIVLP